MKKALTGSFWIFSVLAMAGLGLNSAATTNSHETPSYLLSKEVEEFQSTDADIVGQLVDLASALRIPMGIEGIWSSEEHAVPEIHLRHVTAREALDQLIRQNPEYGWEVTPGGVHVFAHQTVDDQRNCLNIRLPHFLEKDLDLGGMSWMLKLEIKMFLHPERYVNGWGGGYGGYQPPEWKAPISLDVYDTSVRQILNSLISLYGNSIWVSEIDTEEMMEEGRFYAKHSYAPSIAKEYYWDLLEMRSQ